ncbi:hypothetical protein, partial [Klebsiella pneumoniae]|uniref:hypothetical protein n=1 Tax=Klebsiella pneumoniae TaxID=573 RepID=UPI003013F568
APIVMVPLFKMRWRAALACAVVAFLCGGLPQTRAQENLTVGQTPEQVNDRIKSLTMGAHNTPAIHDYFIGSGDLLEV